jgi:hypothetical protein
VCLGALSSVAGTLCSSVSGHWVSMSGCSVVLVVLRSVVDSVVFGLSAHTSCTIGHLGPSPGGLGDGRGDASASASAATAAARGARGARGDGGR